MKELRRLKPFNSQFSMAVTIFLMFRFVGLGWSFKDEGLYLLSLRKLGGANIFGASSNLKKIEGEGDPFSDWKAVALNTAKTKAAFFRRFLLAATAKNDISRKFSIPPSPSPSPLSLPSSPSPFPLSTAHISSPSPISSALSPSNSISGRRPSSSSSKHNLALILCGAIGGFLVIAISVYGIIFCRSNKVATVGPWATGLSEQLQKAFVTGIPKLRRSELETACEDFSNVVGTSAFGTVYKGTLSNGVEIAVVSVAVTSAKDWTKKFESRFRKKIRTLSKVNHKNFINLVGYCEEDEPFTRMMVFEYAPNGTLFEHLHVTEAEHLDWAMRLRIAMGIAYCLEYMHQLVPPVVHSDLNSLVVNLTDDYAAQISDFSFCDDLAAAEMGSASMDNLSTQFRRPENDVYSFGLMLFEMVTGRLPYSLHDGLVKDYLGGHRPLIEILDPTLTSFKEEQLERIGDVIMSCIQTCPQKRPSIREVSAKLREITGIRPDEAIPRLSPLWWAELEIMSIEAN